MDDEALVHTTALLGIFIHFHSYSLVVTKPGLSPKPSADPCPTPVDDDPTQQGTHQIPLTPDAQMTIPTPSNLLVIILPVKDQTLVPRSTSTMAKNDQLSSLKKPKPVPHTDKTPVQFSSPTASAVLPKRTMLPMTTSTASIMEEDSLLISFQKSQDTSVNHLTGSQCLPQPRELCQPWTTSMVWWYIPELFDSTRTSMPSVD